MSQYDDQGRAWAKAKAAELRSPKPEPKWWATPGLPDNHNYVLEGPHQFCHLCGELEPPLRQPTGDELTDRAAMHLVHGVTAHLNATAKEWNG